MSSKPLRKCPGCHETVGADSLVCPRCGVSFRAAAARRFIRWMLIVVLIVWAVGHFGLKRF
jgi:hypothetical protein